MAKKGVLPHYFDTECPLCGDMFTKLGLVHHQRLKHTKHENKPEQKVTMKWQIYLKQELQSLNLRPGDTVLVKMVNDRIIIRPDVKKDHPDLTSEA